MSREIDSAGAAGCQHQERPGGSCHSFPHDRVAEFLFYKNWFFWGLRGSGVLMSSEGCSTIPSTHGEMVHTGVYLLSPSFSEACSPWVWETQVLRELVSKHKRKTLNIDLCTGHPVHTWKCTHTSHVLKHTKYITETAQSTQEIIQSLCVNKKI